MIEKYVSVLHGSLQGGYTSGGSGTLTTSSIFVIVLLFFFLSTATSLNLFQNYKAAYKEVFKDVCTLFCGSGTGAPTSSQQTNITYLSNKHKVSYALELGNYGD